MVVGVLRLELKLHAAQSLKEKRAVVKRVLGRCRERFPVSCAEVGAQGLWQLSELGFTMVAVDEPSIDRVFQKIEGEIESLGLADICARDVEYLHYG